MVLLLQPLREAGVQAYRRSSSCWGDAGSGHQWDGTAEDAQLACRGLRPALQVAEQGAQMPDEVSRSDGQAAPGTPPAAEADEGVGDKPSGGHRLLHILGAVLVGVVLPALLMGALVQLRVSCWHMMAARLQRRGAAACRPSRRW
jgi:hypothetical protein